MSPAVLQTLVDEEVDALTLIKDYLDSSRRADGSGLRPLLTRLREVRQKLDVAAAQYARATTAEERGNPWLFSR